MTVTDKSWTCDVKYEGCETNASISWICVVEGAQISACRSCRAKWQVKVQRDSALQNRCPNCEPVPIRVRDNPKPSKIKKHTQPLTGVIAEALDAAMFHEGILIDVRNKVLLRLATDSPWMAVSQVNEQAAS